MMPESAMPGPESVIMASSMLWTPPRRDNGMFIQNTSHVLVVLFISLCYDYSREWQHHNDQYRKGHAGTHRHREPGEGCLLPLFASYRRNTSFWSRFRRQ